MILDHFEALDRALVAVGFPATSPWWRAQLGRFYRSRCRQLVLRVGRRGGKSSTLCRVAVVEALFGEHVIPPGDVGIVGLISVSRDEASQRLRTIKAILDALRIGYRPIEGGIELLNRPIAFKVFTGSISGVVGGTWICAICDEVARWRDADTGANPAAEVLGSLRPTMATQPHARIFLSSSPLSTEDAHASAFEAGDSGFQLVAHAESWIANPTITEEQTHELEPDARIWSREYAALPSAALSEAFDVDARDRCFRAPPPNFRRGGRTLIVDWSGTKKDASTYAIVGWSWPIDPEPEFEQTREYVHGQGWMRPKYKLDANGEKIRNAKFIAPSPPIFHVEILGGFTGGYWKTASAASVVEHEVRIARKWGARRVIGDQRESFLLASEFQKHGLNFNAIDWTNPRKVDAVERVRRWMREGMLVLPSHDGLKRELGIFQEKILPSGSITYAARGNGHDDYVALLLTSAMADAEGLLESSPHARTVVRYIPTNRVFF